MPLTDTLVVFQELIKLPRLLACQQNVPAPSNVKGTVMVEVTGLQAPPVGWVGVMVGVRVGVLVMTPEAWTILNGLPLVSTPVESV